jgi:hypothetical protein
VWAIFSNLLQYQNFDINLREGTPKKLSQVDYNDLEEEYEGGFDIPTLEFLFKALGAQISSISSLKLKICIKNSKVFLARKCYNNQILVNFC